MLAIIDYGAGNLASVARACAHLDIPARITSSADEIRRARGVIFPGVGNAAQAMLSLRQSGLDAALAGAVDRGQPLLGICLGCQILLESTEEGPTGMLGLIEGDCAKFSADLRDEDGEPIRVPHMGWNSLKRLKDSPLFDGIPDGAEFYFVHSYYPRPAKELALATTFHGQEFCSLYGRDGLWAAQFHPEKSGPAGLKMLANFHNWCESHAV